MEVDYWVFRERRGSKLYFTPWFDMFGFACRPNNSVLKYSSNPKEVINFSDELEATEHVESFGNSWKAGGWRQQLDLVPIYAVESTGTAELDELLPKADTQPVYFIYCPGTNTIKIG